MVRWRVGIYGLLIAAVGLTCQPAQAGDRRSATRAQDDSLEGILIPAKTRAIALKYELAGDSTAKNFTAGASVSARSRSSGRTPTADAPAREHRRLTLFHINSKFGDIAVEPVIGRVNGAKFSIDF